VTDSLMTQPSLLVRLRDAGDEVAWSQFVDLYGPLVYGFLRGKGLQDADVADLTQDVLRQVSVSVKSLEYDAQRGSFRSWLFTVVLNRLRNFQRDEAVRARGAGGTDAWEQLNALSDEAASESPVDWDRAYERQLFHYAASLIRRDFSPATWQAFWMTAVDEQPAKDVALKLEITPAAVYLAKGRVLARLKEQVRTLMGDGT